MTVTCVTLVNTSAHQHPYQWCRTVNVYSCLHDTYLFPFVTCCSIFHTLIKYCFYYTFAGITLHMLGVSVKVVTGENGIRPDNNYSL